MTTMTERWNNVLRILPDAQAITWDGCHKIYILMDHVQADMMHSIGYDPIIAVTDADEALETLQGWYNESCFLRFVQSIKTVDGDPNAGFGWLIDQGDDDEDDE